MTFFDQDGVPGARPTDDPAEFTDAADPGIWAEPVEAATVARSAPPSVRRPPRPRNDDGSVPAPDPSGPGPSRPRPRPAHEDEYFDLPHESRVPRWLAALLVIGLLVVVVGGGAMWWYRNQVDPPGGPGSPVAVQIPEGSTTSDVGQILDDKGVITSAALFNFSSGGRDLTSVQAGTYAFRENMSFDEAIATLEAGPQKPLLKATTSVSIPEGYTVAQIIDRIHERVPRLTVEDLRAALDEGRVPSSLKPADSRNYEGLLFPATYQVDAKATATDVLTLMAQEMETRVAAMGLDDAAADISRTWGIEITPYDVLTIASLVQEEAGSASEAPKVATVIYNRLRDGWRLGIDATSKYLAELEGGEIDLESSSPFNTRTQTGLPPTPIASPGEYALDAAMHPAEGPWMYYVLTEPGVHSFAVSDAEFQRFKQECIAKDLGCG